MVEGLVEPYIRLFEAIPDAETELATFYDADLDTLPPRMFLPSGDLYTPPGPVRLEEIKRKRRVRLVKVSIYRFEHVGLGLAARPYAYAYAWQGDNGILHLYHAPVVLEDVPEVLELDEVTYNESYVRLMRAMGHVDAFIDL
ncbi:hypothetical protein P74p37 [Thermus phage P74-26]|uniref:Thermus phage P23-45 gp39 N-terminal domain-containing protein n=1 Tax=Thermus phage P74-26 TaxID=2914007 RepID=A7XXK5_BP742|nr:hypothetical protein P74p37 [Thermus phage P74-26]ABU96987.1 hypothetical protein P74p37 [Thermus phage P74-26]